MLDIWGRRLQSYCWGFWENGYIAEAAKMRGRLKVAIKDNNVKIPEKFEPIRGEITALVRKASSNLNSKKNKDKKTIGFNKQVYLDPEFKDLWDRIKYKTTYSVDFASEKPMDECCKEVQNSLSVSSAKFPEWFKINTPLMIWIALKILWRKR